MQHISSLTGIRGLAALAVTCSHIMLFQYKNLLNSIGFGGDMAVTFFFVLSGYAITTSLSSQLAHPRKNFIRTMLNYFIKRVFRIYPALIVSLLIYRAFFVKANRRHASIEFLPVLLRGESDQFYWTMQTEMIFYFIVAPIACVVWLAISLTKKRKLFFGLAILLGTLQVVQMHLEQDNYTNPWQKRKEFSAHFPAIWYGFLTAIAADSLKGLKDKKIVSYTSQALLLGVCALIFLTNHYISLLYLGNNNIFLKITPPTQAVLYSIFILLLTLVPESNFVSTGLNNPFWIWVGEMSYGVYLYHHAAILCLKQLPYIQGFDAACATIAVSLLFAGLSYHIIEKPCNRFARYLTNEIKPINVQVPTQSQDSSTPSEKLKKKQKGLSSKKSGYQQPTQNNKQVNKLKNE